MVGLTLTETLGNIFKTSRKSISSEAEKQVVGILAFEISRLMSKVVNLWVYLTDRHMLELREEMANSIGIHKLVCDDEDYLMDLALAEIIENVRSAGKLVATLGKKCADPMYHELEGIFEDPKWYGWRYRLKKMEKRVKKMERFVAATEQLHSEMEELEGGGGRARNLREMSPWIRTYDYIVRLLLRSLFTIIERIKYVYSMPLGYSSDNLSPLNLIRFAPVGLARCIDSEIFTSSCGTSNGDQMEMDDNNLTVPSTNVSLFNSKRQMLNARPSTLGYSALALHYAKIIISIEKLASSPYLISLDARDDLYDMLPYSIRRCVRAKEMNDVVSTTLPLSEYNLARILGWISPLAHNMVRWQSERNFERKRVILGTNVLLVQTLYFADRQETEAAIVELLFALNHLSRFRQSSPSNVGDLLHFPT